MCKIYTFIKLAYSIILQHLLGDPLMESNVSQLSGNLPSPSGANLPIFHKVQMPHIRI